MRQTTTCDEWHRDALGVDVKVPNDRSATVPDFFCDVRRMPMCPISETYLTTVFYQILSSACLLQKSHRGLFLDIGANAGFYSLYGATVGCEVLSFEMQTGVFDSSLVKVNHLCDRISLVNHPVADSHRRTFIHGEAGWAHMESSKLPGDDAEAGAWTVTLPFILQYERRPIVLTKIDTEGAEIVVLRSLLEALAAGHVFENIVLEFTPSWWSRYGVGVSQGVDVLREFEPLGYELYTIQWCQRARLETCSKIDCTPENIRDITCEPPGNVSWADPDFEHVRRVGFGGALAKLTAFLAKFDSDVYPPVHYGDPTHTVELWISKTKGPRRYVKGPVTLSKRVLGQ